jgi:hypothetical protein
MNTQTDHEHVFLHHKTSNREQAYLKNRRLLNIHKLLFLGILGTLFYFAITDPNYVAEYSESKVTYFIGMSAWFIVALFLSYVAMWFPALLFAKEVSPEILLTETELIYLPGSVSLNYSMIAGFHRPLIYLLGYDMAQGINRDQIVIKHKSGEIKIGLWLSQDEKQEIARKLNDWIK